jgi:hypothetical protein
MLNKFDGSFAAATRQGAGYCNPQRFKPLKTKPLWEFKEHDHRVYCYRVQQGNRVEIILLNGWVKDKGARGKEEERQIGTAFALFEEYTTELTAGGKRR